MVHNLMVWSNVSTKRKRSLNLWLIVNKQRMACFNSNLYQALRVKMIHKVMASRPLAKIYHLIKTYDTSPLAWLNYEKNDKTNSASIELLHDIFDKAHVFGALSCGCIKSTVNIKSLIGAIEFNYIWSENVHAFHTSPGRYWDTA